MDVDINPAIAFNYLHCLFDMTQAALTENIIFIQTDILRLQHAELCGWITLRWHIGCCVPGDRFFRDEHTSGMNTQVTGEVNNACCIEPYQSADLIGSIGMTTVVDKRVNLRFRKTENFSQFAYNSFELKS
jgi:hypothetical protein